MSRKRRRSQSGLSQPTPSTSQMTIEESFAVSQDSEETVKELVNKCVRYVVYQAGSKLPIKKSDLQSHLFKNSKRGSLDVVLERAARVLKRVYGYNLQPCEYAPSNKPKAYIVSNYLPYVNSDSEESEDENTVPADISKVLTMLILAHIFMSSTSIPEASLFGFLKSLHIDPEKQHEVFGNIKECINILVKQKYLEVTTEDHTKRAFYDWGVRAEKEVSKLDLLKFVAKIYGNREAESWKKHFEIANQQQISSAQKENGSELMAED